MILNLWVGLTVSSYLRIVNEIEYYFSKGNIKTSFEPKKVKKIYLFPDLPLALLLFCLGFSFQSILSHFLNHQAFVKRIKTDHGGINSTKCGRVLTVECCGRLKR